MNSPTQGRALFYHRDSGGKAEMTPAQYVAWAQQQAKAMELSFDGTPEKIDAMIRERRSVDRDLFLDYDVKGNVLSRTGLNALIQEAAGDPKVVAILIPRRDRLARPDDPIDGIKLENGLRLAGKSVVYMDRKLPPLKKGRKADIAELIIGLVDFDRAEKDRRDLAQKILHAQFALARQGWATGGRPPYGFRRWLVRDDGARIRELASGERVRMAGHHVVWLPTAEEEIKVIERILSMLRSMPACRVAAQLTRERVPSPDSGRCRTDRGIRHCVSGVWHQTTVTGIARNPLLMAIASYGLRSMGDKLRFSPTGPRELEDADFRADEKPKVIRNREDQRIAAPARFSPVVDVAQHRELLAELDARGGTQRGKPRSKNPERNPLGGRIFDMNCTWPMYRATYGKTFRYGCGSYLQSHGNDCDHNTVNGPVATRFMLSCLRQRLFAPRLLKKLEQRFREMAARDKEGHDSGSAIPRLRADLAQLQKQLKTVSSNMALAKNPAQFESISATFDELQARETVLKTEIAKTERDTLQPEDAEAKVAEAMSVIERLQELAAGDGGLQMAGEAFRIANARLFLRFQPVQMKKRTVNKVAGGVVVFGNASDPIEVYRGPTGRRALNYNGSATSLVAEPGKLALPSPPEATIGSGSEGKSLRNVSRGDWI